MSRRRAWRAARIVCGGCGYEGKALPVLRPRPSGRRTRVCPACFIEVQREREITTKKEEVYTGAVPMG